MTRRKRNPSASTFSISESGTTYDASEGSFKQRQKRVGSATDDWKADFYPPEWRGIFKNIKLKINHHVLCEDPFPEKEYLKVLAKEFLAEEMRGRTDLEESKLSIDFGV